MINSNLWLGICVIVLVWLSFLIFHFYFAVVGQHAFACWGRQHYSNLWLRAFSCDSVSGLRGEKNLSGFITFLSSLLSLFHFHHYGDFIKRFEGRERKWEWEKTTHYRSISARSKVSHIKAICILHLFPLQSLFPIISCLKSFVLEDAVFAKSSQPPLFLLLCCVFPAFFASQNVGSFQFK